MHAPRITAVALCLLTNAAGMSRLLAQGGAAGPIASVAVSPRALRLGVDDRGRLVATAKDSVGRAVALAGKPVSWSSSDTAVATVDPASGAVTAVGAGSAMIGADVAGLKTSARVTVIGWKSITAGNDFACGITTEGRGFCWGEQAFGDLGRDRTGGSSVPLAVTGNLTFTSVNSGLANSSCALADGAAAYCWGFNNEGQVGDGTKDPTGGLSVPTRVTGDIRWMAVSGGYNYACGVATDSVAYCWGASAFGLGNGSASSSLTPAPVEKVARFVTISVGYGHACGLGGDAAVYCWGDNSEGDLGDGQMQKPSQVPVKVANVGGFSAVDAGFGFTCGVTAQHAAYCWGRDDAGQLGNGGGENSALPVQVQASGGEGFTAVSAGGTHACAVAVGGAAYCWGSNQYGELGNDSADSVGVPVRVTDPAKPLPQKRPMAFASVTAGQSLSCGVTTAGRGYCWGKGDDGQLGSGGTASSQRPVRVPVPR